MLLFGVLVIAYGAFGTVRGNFMHDILQCANYKAITIPHKNLVESEEGFAKMCEQQVYYYNCLETRVDNFDIEDEEYWASTVVEESYLNGELCNKASKWRKKYLDVAPCINKQHLDYCTSYTFLCSDGIVAAEVSPDPCNLRQKAISCITDTLTENCNSDAADVFNYLLSMTTVEKDKCLAIGSEMVFPCNTLGINGTMRVDFRNVWIVKRIGTIPEQSDGSTSDPPVEQFYDPSILLDGEGNSVKTEETSNDIYNDLMDRIGKIPEQEGGTALDSSPILEQFYEVDPSVLMDRVGEFERTEETIADIYDSLMNRIDGIPEQKEAASDVIEQSHGVDPSVFLLDKIGESVGKTETITDDIFNSLMDRIGRIPEQKDITTANESSRQFHEADPPVMLDRVREPEENKIADAIAIALDSLDHNSESEATSLHANYPVTYASDGQRNLKVMAVNRRPRSAFLTAAYEDLKYASAFKHHDERISAYIRIPGYFPVQSIKCSYKMNMTRKDFHCRAEFRTLDPVCRRRTFGSDSERKIIPKDIDPEFGVRFYIPFPFIEYPFRQFLKVDVLTDWLPEQTENFEKRSETVYTKDNPYAKTGPHESTPDYTSTVESFLEKIYGSDSFKTEASEETSKNLDRNSGFTEQTVQNDAATLGYLSEVIGTASQTKTEGSKTTTIIPSIVQAEFDSLFKPISAMLHDSIDVITEKLEYLKFQISNDLLSENRYSYDIYWRDIKGETLIEALICGRVNECHPLAKYIFKCVLAYKHDKETCGDNCTSEESKTSSLESSQADIQSEVKVYIRRSEGHGTLLQLSNLSEYLESSEDWASIDLSEDTDDSSEFDSVSHLVNSKSNDHIVQTNTEQISNLKSPTKDSLANQAKGVYSPLIQPESKDPIDEQGTHSVAMSGSTETKDDAEFTKYF